jgi:hypothetical protein
MEKWLGFPLVTPVLEFFGRRKPVMTNNLAENDLFTPVLPLNVPVWGRYLNLPAAVAAVISFPDGRQSVHKEGGVLRLPPGNYGVHYVNMRRQIVHLPNVQAKSKDGWGVVLAVDITWQIKQPSQIVNTQQPLQTLENLCRAAVVNFIQSTSHNELVSTPGVTPLKEEEIARGILDRLSANPGLSGFQFISVNLLTRQGDPDLIKTLREQVLTRERVAVSKEQENLALQEARIKSTVARTTAETEAEVTQIMRSVELQRVEIKRLSEAQHLEQEQYLEMLRANMKAYSEIISLLTQAQMTPGLRQDLDQTIVLLMNNLGTLTKTRPPATPNLPLSSPSKGILPIVDIKNLGE